MKVHICCGERVMAGWTNVDQIKCAPGVIQADLRKPWRFAAPHSVDEFYCKDGFEHFERGEFFLEQAAALLRSGGTITLWVPHYKNPSAYRLTHKRLMSWNFFDVFPELHDAVQNLVVVSNKIYIGKKESKLFEPIHRIMNRWPKWWERLFYVSNIEVTLRKK